MTRSALTRSAGAGPGHTSTRGAWWVKGVARFVGLDFESYPQRSSPRRFDGRLERCIMPARLTRVACSLIARSRVGRSAIRGARKVTIRIALEDAREAAERAVSLSCPTT